MKSQYLILYVLFLFSTPSLASGNLSFFSEVGAAYTSTSLKQSSSTEGSFTGVNPQFHLEFKNEKVILGQYDLGYVLKIMSLNLKNKMNTSTLAETYSGTRIHLGVRIHALNLFFGAGVMAGKSTLTSENKLSSTKNSQKYSELGGSLEIGTRIYLSQWLHLTPHFSFTGFSADPVNSSASNVKGSDTAINLNLGFYF